MGLTSQFMLRSWIFPAGDREPLKKLDHGDTFFVYLHVKRTTQVTIWRMDLGAGTSNREAAGPQV